LKFLAGLGNPGDQYRETRHNAGFRFLDFLAETLGLRFAATPRFHAETAEWRRPEGKVLLIKPQTFMNNSGEALGLLARYYAVITERIFIVHDDIDLPSGRVRLRSGGGHGGHNGLKSLNAHLPDTNYHRIKIGIGRPVHGEITPWVLGRLSENERADEARIFNILVSEIHTILDGNLPAAASHIHLGLQKEA